MPTRYADLPTKDADGRITAVIDTPRGSRAKYKLDADTDLFRLSKLLPVGAVFPGNFGFIPGTRGDDGDQIDVLILSDEVLCLGVVVPVRLIGVLCAEQGDGQACLRNDRLLGVIETEYNPAEFRDIDDLHPRRVDELVHFFTAYNQAQGRTFKVISREGAEAALEHVKRAMF